MNPLQWKTCPTCKCNLVDDEISESIKKFCEPNAFHSKLLGGRDERTWKIVYWKCPDCNTVFKS